MIENLSRCTHGMCDARGTHKAIVILLSEGEPPLVKKWDPLMPRCAAHLTREVDAFMTEAAWRRLQASFVRDSGGAMAIRARTTVQYAEIDQPIQEIPVMVQTPGGLEQAGKARIVS